VIQPWTLLSSEMAFDHRWYKLRRDTVQLPDGRIIDDYFVSQRPDVAIVVPLTRERDFILVRQYKHGAQAITLEFPAGTFRSESAEAAAARELEEETGYSPGSMIVAKALAKPTTCHVGCCDGFRCALPILRASR
jgi:8-oxo-dGTP pyrophosphatase MutT (NUDIX family)